MRMKALWFAGLLLVGWIVTGCRAPGTYVRLARPLRDVRQDILRYVEAQEERPVSEDAAVPLELAKHMQSPKLAAIPWGQTKCLGTNSVPDRAFAVRLVTYRPSFLVVFGPDLTIIEARHKKPNATDLHIYCSRGERAPSPLFDVFRNESREYETLRALDP